MNHTFDSNVKMIYKEKKKKDGKRRKRNFSFRYQQATNDRSITGHRITK